MALMAASARLLPISDGLLDHRRNMRSSIWEYLWLLAHVTAEDSRSNGESLGIVEHGNPVPTSRIAADLGRSRDATLTNLERLEAGNYIERSAAVGHAYDYRVKILLKDSAG
jgi:biotin operon repressor